MITRELYKELTSLNNEEKAEVLGVMLNSFGRSPQAIAVAFAREHRTIQQCFTRLCRAWLEYCASDEYRYDDRNEASHKFGKAVMDALEGKDISLPFI